jgi:hypothetical protein
MGLPAVSLVAYRNNLTGCACPKKRCPKHLPCVCVQLGSYHAAVEYLRQLPRGIVNVSFSTAGLGQLPDMGRCMPHGRMRPCGFRARTSDLNGYWFAAFWGAGAEPANR